jgi:kynurenine formamidase
MEAETLATGPAPVSAQGFADIYEACKHWGRWGHDDQRGAINFITPDHVRAAAASVRSGRTVACSWPLDTKAGPDNPKPVVHHMTMLQDVHLGDAGDLRFACDFVGIEFHGDAHSHLDALCHVAYKGLLYNGVPVDQAVSSVGASMQSMEVAKDGIVGRGVLLDIPRLRNTAWVEPGEAVYRDEIEAAEEAQGVRLQEGDILFFRTGHARKRLDDGPWVAASSKAGFHATAMPLFHERRIAAIGFDGDGETVPSNCEGVRYPIHAIGVNAMGLYFLDSLFLEDLAVACEQESRWDFLCVIAPLRLAAGTGSPVNPIAML